MLSADQLAMRRTLVGASEVAAIIGVPTYFDDLAVWLRKQPIDDGEGPIREDVPSLAMAVGNAVEPLIVSRWAEENGVTVIDSRHPDHPGTVRHPKYPHIGATPDGLVVEWNHGLEAKWSDGRNGAFEDGALPDAHFVQCQINAEVFDRDVWHWAAIVRGEWLTGSVARDRELGRRWCEMVEAWWSFHVAGGQAPAAKRGASARDYFDRRFPRSMGNMLPARPDDVATARELFAVKRAIKEAEERAETLENALKNRIGEADGIAGVATWKSEAKGRPAWKAIAEEMGPPPALVAKHTGEPVRKFLLKVKE